LIENIRGRFLRGRGYGVECLIWVAQGYGCCRLFFVPIGLPVIGPRQVGIERPAITGRCYPRVIRLGKDATVSRCLTVGLNYMQSFYT